MNELQPDRTNGLEIWIEIGYTFGDIPANNIF